MRYPTIGEKKMNKQQRDYAMKRIESIYLAKCKAIEEKALDLLKKFEG